MTNDPFDVGPELLPPAPVKPVAKAPAKALEPEYGGEVTATVERQSRPSPPDRRQPENSYDLPPQNLEAERCTLGCVLLDFGDCMPRVQPILQVSDFYTSAHQAIYSAMCKLEAAGVKVDPVIVGERMERDGTISELGEHPYDYLTELFAAVPHTAHAAYYADMVRQASIRRQLISAARQLERCCRDVTIEPADAMAECSALLEGILSRTADSAAQPIGPLVSEAIVRAVDRREAGGEITGARTGLGDIDLKLGHAQPGQLIVLAARPSMGKTALCMQLAEGVARHNSSAILFSLEQEGSELANRQLSAASSVPGKRIRTGKFNDEEYERFLDVAENYRDLPLLIDDNPRRSVSQITACVRLAQRKRPVSAVFVDYLQLVTPTVRTKSREQDVAQMMREFKMAARNLGVPFYLLAQLNRALEARPDKRPRLSDLRESGSIEQDADIVMFLHRAEVYDPEDRPGEADLIVAKYRNGDTGDIVLRWVKELTRFECPATEWQEADWGSSDSNDGHYGFFEYPGLPGG